MIVSTPLSLGNYTVEFALRSLLIMALEPLFLLERISIDVPKGSGTEPSLSRITKVLFHF